MPPNPPTPADRDTRRAHLPGGYIKLNYHDFGVAENAQALDVRVLGARAMGGCGCMGACVLARSSRGPEDASGGLARPSREGGTALGIGRDRCGGARQTGGRPELPKPDPAAT